MAFQGKVTLITGGNDGIGAACAEYFAKEGALLALVGRKADKFQLVLKKIEKSGIEAEPLCIIADITTDAKRVFQETIEKYGRLDILINNAGILNPDTIGAINMDKFDQTMSTNLRAVVELTNFVIPHLIESKGVIINVSSICGILAKEGMLSYCCSKAALDQFTKVVSMELSTKGVRCNSVNPGVIDTDIHSSITGTGLRGEDTFNAYLEMSAKKHPIGRNGLPEECASAIAFLAKETFITGVILPVDGGITKKSAF